MTDTPANFFAGIRVAPPKPNGRQWGRSLNAGAVVDSLEHRRHLASGTFDSTFDVNGIAFIDNAAAINDAFAAGGIATDPPISFASKVGQTNYGDTYPSYTSVAPDGSGYAVSRVFYSQINPNYQQSRFAYGITKLKPNGIADSSFGNNGALLSDFIASSVGPVSPNASYAVNDADVSGSGYLYVAGGIIGENGSGYYATPAITRYSSTGVEDTSYLSGNISNRSGLFTGIAFQVSGGIDPSVIVVDTEGSVNRVLPDGTYDANFGGSVSGNSFDTGVPLDADLLDVRLLHPLDPASPIYVLGAGPTLTNPSSDADTASTLYRLNADGTGAAVLHRVTNTDVLATFPDANPSARFRAIPDGYYGGQLFYFNSRPNGLIRLDSDGKTIVAAGFEGDGTILYRLTSTGQLDPTFGTGGMVRIPNVSPTGLEIISSAAGDYKVLLLGEPGGLIRSQAELIQFNSDGTPDPTFPQVVNPLYLPPYGGEYDGAATAELEEDFGTLPIPRPRLVIAGSIGLTQDNSGRPVLAGGAAFGYQDDDGVTHSGDGILMYRLMSEGDGGNPGGGDTQFSTVIDFEANLNTRRDPTAYDLYHEDGYDLLVTNVSNQPTSDKLLIYGPSSGYSSHVAQPSNFGEGVQITRSDSGTFGPVSFDLLGSIYGNPADIDVHARLSDGSVVNAGVFCTQGSKTDATTVNVLFENIVLLEYNFQGGLDPDGMSSKYGAYGAVDNITIFSDTPVTPEAIPGGLTGTYFNNANFTDEKFSRVDPTVTLYSGFGSPAPSIDPDTFSIRWSGAISAPVAGSYIFRVSYDDGILLKVGGQTLIDDLNNGPERISVASVPVTFATGSFLPISISYLENTGASNVRFEWLRPSDFDFTPVSESYLRPTL